MSFQKNYLQNINQNKIPNDLYADTIFIYKLFDTNSGSRILTLEQLYSVLYSSATNILFTIEEVAVLFGKFGKNQQKEVTTLKSNVKIRSSIEIPNLNKDLFNLGNLYLFSKNDLSEFIDVELGDIRLPIGIIPFVSTGVVNIGKNGTFFSELQAFTSYQFSFIDSTSGVEINSLITLSFKLTQGTNVSNILVERSSYSDLSRNSVVILDDNNVALNYNIDFDKSSPNFFGDFDHIEIAVDPNNQVEIFSHSYTSFRLIDWMVDNADVFIGVHPQFIIINDFGGGFAGNADKSYIMNQNNVEDQLNLEFIKSGQYYRFLYNYRGIGATDFEEPWRDDTYIKEIIPQNAINNVTILHSVTEENNPILQNPNNNEEYWFSSDYKTDKAFVLSAFGDQNYGVDFTKAKSIKEANITRAKDLINALNNGSLITYKGMTINELPDVLETQNKGNYQDFINTNQDEIDFYVATTYPLQNSFNSRKNVFDGTNPIKVTNNRVYGINFYDRTKPWPVASNFQKLSKNKNLLFLDTKPIDEMINLQDQNVHFKTFSNRGVGGGSRIKITQLDSNFNRSIDADGVPVPTIVLPTNWFLNENQTLTVTSFSFIASVLTKIFNSSQIKLPNNFKNIKFKNLQEMENIKKLFKIALQNKYEELEIKTLWNDRNKNIVINPTEIQKKLYDIKLAKMEYNYNKDDKTKTLIKTKWWKGKN